MQTNDRKKFVEVLNGLASIKRYEFTTQAYELWWRSMQDWSIEDFAEAATYLVKNCQFMPTPYDFEQLRKAAKPSAHEAWATALSFANGGWRKSNSCGEESVDAAVASIGGWQVVALCDIEKLGFLERRFLETYNDFADREEVRTALPQITVRNGKATSLANITKQVGVSSMQRMLETDV